jgi:hypothetical protein
MLLVSPLRSPLQSPLVSPFEVVGGGGIDPDAAGWAAAVTLAGSTYTAATLTAINTIISGLKADSVWTSLYTFGPMAGNDLTAARIQYRNGVWESAGVTNFVGGDYTESTGVTGNIAGTKWWDTLTPQNVFTQASRHIGVYLRQLTSAINTTYIGSQTASNVNVFELSSGAAATTMQLLANAANSSGGNSVAGTSAGHFCGVQTVATDSVMYRNGVSADTGAALTAATPGAITTALFARNFSPVVRYSDAIIAGYHIGTGLTAPQAAALYARLQTFNTALGRQV